MTTFSITNTYLEGDKTVIFFTFSNGSDFSNKFALNTKISDILKWGQDRCDEFDEKERVKQSHLMEIEELIQ